MQVCGLSLGGFGDRRGKARRSAQPDGGFFGGNGAGEGIRTLDPDLGKVFCAFFRDIPWDALAFLTIDK